MPAPTATRGSALDTDVLLAVLSDVKAGNLSARMPINWTGVPGKVADGLNEMIDASYEAMGAIRAMPQWGELPIIAVTGKVVGSERERCIAAGASDYITKPVDSATLLAAIGKWLPSGRPDEGLRV
jgi:CheY-like chemotaxis protein